jgi:hypothetical protein
MTREYILVSPLIPACPKSGVNSPAFRPADQGDTAALSATEEVCLSPVYPIGAFSFPPSLCLCDLPHQRRSSYPYWLVCGFFASALPQNQKSARSFHPHGTALFRSVPRNEIFSFPCIPCLRFPFPPCATSPRRVLGLCHWSFSLCLCALCGSPIHALISPAWYRIISRRTAKRNFSFSLFFVSLCLCVRIPKPIFLQTAELNQK